MSGEPDIYSEDFPDGIDRRLGVRRTARSTDRTLSDADVKAIAIAINGEISDEEQRVLKALASHSTVEAVEELAKFAGWLVTGQQAIGKLMIRLTIGGIILLIVILFGGRIDLSNINIGK